jgi:hypothetical protein
MLMFCPFLLSVLQLLMLQAVAGSSSGTCLKRHAMRLAALIGSLASMVVENGRRECFEPHSYRCHMD